MRAAERYRAREARANRAAGGRCLGETMARILRNIPVHAWLILLYVALYFLGAVASEDVEQFFVGEFFRLPLLGEASIPISVTTLFMVVGFVAQWLEAIRATQVRGSTLNDVFSIFLAFGALVLFIGVEQFQTTAFLVVVVVGFGDVLLDRIIGQAVAQRDFGGMIPGGH